MQTRPDAQGMRHAAGQFRSKAERVAAVVNRLNAQLATMAFAGPAADEFRSAINAERARLGEVMRILGQAADVLHSSAASVDADPAGFYSTGSAGAS
jgi:uncharacterized protein YukE